MLPANFFKVISALATAVVNVRVILSRPSLGIVNKHWFWTHFAGITNLNNNILVNYTR